MSSHYDDRAARRPNRPMPIGISDVSDTVAGAVSDDSDVSVGGFGQVSDALALAVKGLPVDEATVLEQMTDDDVADVLAGRIPLETVRAFARVVAEGWRSSNG